ncbi:prolyl-tRNA synthetase [Geopyxis carbonaria]|nr:prolyl-tRNA synthetase [Geopyxis carbonaria]
MSQLALRSATRAFRCPACSHSVFSRRSTRNLTIDHRSRISNFFIPSGGIAQNKDGQPDEIHALLLRTGYLRQAHSGIFHFLPLGLRVQDKLERLIDKHMRSIGASRLALSSITTEKLWKKTGRLEKAGAELLRFNDRKGGKYLLAPTHEEEITTLIAGLVGSYKQLPLRVYQIGRKYRDERRPRAGLLRGREFTMKDLYTFDSTEAAALETYKNVQVAYKALFDELKLPYLVAEAESGNMGGSLSHEYLYPSATGEDIIMSCTDCGYTSNSEAALPRAPAPSTYHPDTSEIAVHHSITSDRKTLINTYYFKSSATASGNIEANQINTHRIKELVPNLDPSVGQPLELYRQNFTPYNSSSKPESYSQVINLFDAALPHSITESSFSNHTDHAANNTFIADKRIPTTTITTHPSTGERTILTRARSGDHCPRCTDGSLKSTTAIELGHTFHLGTRYTDPLSAMIFNSEQKRVPMQQGCHGIGVSRMIPAIAEGFRDSKGLCWPRVIAPFEVCVIDHPEGSEDSQTVYDILAGRGLDGAEKEEIDVIYDDREKELVWKMKDADLVGYPVVCIMGKSWKQDRKIEIQCRQKGVCVEVELGQLRSTVSAILADV